MAVRQAHPASHVNRQVHPTGAEMRAVRIHRFALPFFLGGDVVTS